MRPAAAAALTKVRAHALTVMCWSRIKYGNRRQWINNSLTNVAVTCYVGLVDFRRTKQIKGQSMLFKSADCSGIALTIYI